MPVKLREDHFQIISIFLLTLLILPFFILCFFNHPCPEDMSWTENAHRNGFFRSQITLLSNEGSRYLTYALLSLNPLILHSITGYKLLIFFSLIIFLVSIYFFSGEFFNWMLTGTECFLISSSILFAFFFGMPSLAEGFYYLTGSALYNLSLVLLMFFLIGYKKYNESDTSSGKRYFGIISIVLFIAVAGTSELAIALMFAAIIIDSSVNLISGKKLSKLQIFLLVLIVLAVIFLVMSPGNLHRSEKYNLKHDFSGSIYNSLSFTLSEIYYRLFKTPVAGISVLLLPLFFSFADKIKSNENKFNFLYRVNPFTAVIFSFIILFSLNFLIYYSINIIPYLRIQNFVYFVFVILCLYNVMLFCIYLTRKFKINFKPYEKYSYFAGIVIISLFLLQKNNNVRIAYSELIRGTAAEYDGRMYERYEAIEECNKDSCEVDSIKVSTKSLSIVQLTGDPMNNFNRWYSRYFHKKYIYLKKE